MKSSLSMSSGVMFVVVPNSSQNLPPDNEQQYYWKFSSHWTKQ
ncbi:MAG TPA: hypothetical protein VN857_03535 [Chthoniobacterales bacterium]|nr:hypothetical protein [Chthoniobacterales bacterium]